MPRFVLKHQWILKKNVNLSINWPINTLLIVKLGLWQVCGSCLIKSYTHFGNDLTGCWLVYGGGCFMQRQYRMKITWSHSDCLSYAGEALIKVTGSADSAVPREI